jgi:hypothetical protein
MRCAAWVAVAICGAMIAACDGAPPQPPVLAQTPSEIHQRAPSQPQRQAPVAVPAQAWLELPPDHPLVTRQPAGRLLKPLVGEAPADPGALGDGKAVALLPDPDYPTRQRKRMNIDQLDAALLQASGGLTWMVAGKNQFEALSATLGKPDYADQVMEDLSPSTIFQKFLQDAALNVCEALIAKDAKAKPAEQVFFVHALPTATPAKDPAAVEQNLRYLLLRWHGRQLPKGAPQLENWRFLLAGAQKTASGTAAAQAQAGWQAVCVALATHPSFYTY